jgi:hypothetical protein
LFVLKVSFVHPLIFSIFTIFLVIFPIYTRPIEVGVGVAIALSGLPAYFLFFNHNKEEEERVHRWERLEKISGKYFGTYSSFR